MRWLNKPEYFYRPHQACLRIWRSLRPNPSPWQSLATPWGQSLEVCVNEAIGRSLSHFGLYDLVVSEALFRLCDPGECVANVGANVGYMTGLLAARVGAEGTVHAFEPHPVLFQHLQANFTSGACSNQAAVHLHRVALAQSDGEDFLSLPPDFERNMGLATLASVNPAAGQKIAVTVRAWDSVFPGGSSPTLMKVDVEGAEDAVFQGAERSLAGGQVRDIVFEEHRAYPAPSMLTLERHGFSLFLLHKGFGGPELKSVTTARDPRAWEPTSFLATRDADRARSRFAARGWNVLKPRAWQKCASEAPVRNNSSKSFD